MLISEKLIKVMSHEFRNSTEFCETFSRKKFCLSLRQTCINEFLKCSYLTPVKLGCLVLNGCILLNSKSVYSFGAHQ